MEIEDVESNRIIFRGKQGINWVMEKTGWLFFNNFKLGIDHFVKEKWLAGAWASDTDEVRIVAFILAVDFVKMYCALNSWICWLQFSEVFHTLVIAYENYWIKWIF